MKIENIQTYTKINTLYKRDVDNGNRIILGDFSMKEFELLSSLKWEISEKLDGTNTRIAYNTHTKEILLGGRTERSNLCKEQQEYFNENRDFLLEKLGEIFPTENFTNETVIVIFGEIFGGKVQKVGPKYGSIRFRVFDILIGSVWLEFNSVLDIATKLDMKVAPQLGLMTLKEAEEYVLSKPTSKDSDDNTLLMEGVVAKAPLGLRTRMGQRLLVKIKLVDYQKIGKI